MMESSVWMAALVGYGIGSVPFGYVLARFYGVDVREHGSGNVGATNVTRLLGRWLGLVTFVLDAGKAAVVMAVFLSDALPLQVAMVCVVLGHMFPIWLYGRGGKGVAVLVGIVLVLEPVLLVALIGVWGIVFLLEWLCFVGIRVHGTGDPVSVVDARRGCVMVCCDGDIIDDCSGSLAQYHCPVARQGTPISCAINDGDGS